MNTKSSLLTLALSLSAAISTNAQIIYDFDFDTGPATPGTTQVAIDPNTIPVSYSTTNTDGVGAGSAGVATMDSSGFSPSGIIFGNVMTGSRNGAIATSLNASDYVLTFDIKAIGLVGSEATGGQVQLSFNFANTVTASGLTVTDTFQQFSYNLGSDFGSVPTINIGNLNNNMNFRVDFFSAHNGWGYGDEKSLVIDNVQITQVPEPSTYAIAAGLLTLGITLFIRRRR